MRLWKAAVGWTLAMLGATVAITELAILLHTPLVLGLLVILMGVTANMVFKPEKKCK